MPIDHEKMMGAGLEHARKKREAGKESPGDKEAKEKKEKRTNREVLTRAVEKLERCIETFPKDSIERKRAEHTLASVRYAIKYEGKKGAPKGKNA
ncbi:MAG: hypothetical protein NTX98_03750, partial [Candidatus Doudnabacteria bacterium]|nr:hypothetical protein [Candidatus Doudnabacteria bacterium]